MKRLFFLLLLSVFLVSCNPRQPIYEETRFLMDTVCTIRAGGDSKSAVHDAFALVEEIQASVNLYSPDSTITRINRAKAGEPVPLDNHTASILSVALAVSQASDGAFDVTVAPLSILWPFHGEESPQPPEHIAIQNALPHVGYDKLILDQNTQTVTKTDDGVSVDLGGAAKGYAADCAVQILKDAGVPYAILDFGGTIYVYGHNPNRHDGVWQIGIQDPHGTAGSYRTTVSVSEGAVGTSGTYQRNFVYDGRLYHHILNPKTGYPADSGLASVSIQADSALVADCLSTACLVQNQGDALVRQFGGTLVAAYDK